MLTLISSVASRVRKAAFRGQLTVILIDTIAVSTAPGIPHTVGEKGTLLRGTPSDLSVAAAAAVQALVADCLSTSGVFHKFFLHGWYCIQLFIRPRGLCGYTSNMKDKLI